MEEWKTISKKTVLDYGKFLKVENHELELPNGRIINDWPWLITPDFVNIVVLTKENKFLCLKQIKYALDGISLAPIGGYIDPGEKPIDAAKREMMEETGYASDDWIELGNYIIDANRGVGRAYLYLVENAYKVTDPVPDDLEELELILLTQDELIRSLNTGEFKVLSWAANVSLALRHLNK